MPRPDVSSTVENPFRKGDGHEPTFTAENCLFDPLKGWTKGNSQGAPPAKDHKGCDQDNGGLTLPPGFCASVFADNLGRARHLTVAPNGDVYVNTWSSSYTQLKNAPGGYIVALRDTNRDGKAEMVQRFGPVHQDGKAGGGTGIAVHRDALYVEDIGKIVRYGLDEVRIASMASVVG